MSRNPGGARANPTAAVVVSLIVLVMGIWMIRTQTSALSDAFGTMLVVIGVVGAAANLYIRHKWR
ncbi:MAG: hypothetical protein ACK5MT_04105 [Actinomycetales bacterium]